MPTFAAFQQAILSVLLVPGVKACFAISRSEETRRGANDLPRSVLVSVTATARRLLDENVERHNQHVGGFSLIARRFDDVVVVIVVDASVDEIAVNRKLNALLVRMRLAMAKETPSPLAIALREAYVAVVGDDAGATFDRALEELRGQHSTVDAKVLLPFGETLAAALTAPTNAHFRQRLAEIARPWQVAPAARPPVRPPTTVPKMAAVQGVVRDFAGPLGDLLVQRALESFTSAATGSALDEQLIAEIAAKLPPHRRQDFIAACHAALTTRPRTGAESDSEIVEISVD